MKNARIIAVLVLLALSFSGCAIFAENGHG